MIYILLSAITLFLLYCLALRGRRNHPGWQALEGWNYAHRGLHDQDKPENSMAAFRAAVENGYGIELDLHLMKDGQLAVIHDSNLKRTTGTEGRVEDLTAEDLPNYHLEGTDETIPIFPQVLELFAGRVPMIVELKSVGNNYAEVSQAACDLLENYDGPYCLESFDPRCIRWLKKHRPHLIRGQLAEDFCKVKNHPVPWILRFCLTYQLPNFLTLPDFTAYRFRDRKNLSNFLVRRLWGIRGVTWTLQTPQDHENALQEGWIPIFENYKP